MAGQNVSATGENAKWEFLKAMAQLDDEGVDTLRTAAKIVQRGGTAANLLRTSVYANEAGFTGDSQDLIIREPISDLYDVSNGLDFIADKLENSDQPGAANLLRVLGRQVADIASHLDDNNWEPRKVAATMDQ